MSETWNISYGYALLETGITAEKVVDRIAAWFRDDNGVDVGADNPVTDSAGEVVRKWQSRDANTGMITAGNWADTMICVYNSEPFGIRPGDLVFIHDYRGDLEPWQDMTVDVKARFVGLVQNQSNWALKAACIVTGESLQLPKGARVTVPISHIRPRKKRK